MSLVEGPSPAWSDERLIAACLRDDERAWSALVDKYKRLIYSVAFRYRLDPDEAGDVFQSVCMEILTGLGKLRAAQALGSWIVTVTSRRSLLAKRQRALRGTDEGLVEDATQDQSALTPDVLEEIEREQSVRNAIAQLSPRCGELVRMLFYEQPPVPYDEVARRLGLATGSIGFIRGRCLKKLQALLEKGGF